MSDGSKDPRGNGALLVAAVCAAGLAGIIYFGLSSELHAKSEVVSVQEKEIQDYKAQVEAHKLQLEAKSSQLEEARESVNSLAGQLAERESQLANKQAELEERFSKTISLREQLAAADDQNALLSTEISVLQSKIQSDERRIAELTAHASSQRVIVSHYGLGIDQDGNGTVFPIRVEVISPGTGILSVDINNVQYEPGFQAAVRSAAIAAEQFTGQSISDKDIVVRFAPGGQMTGQQPVKIDGSSAGAIISAMIVSGLTDTEIDTSVLVTGTISEAGAVGRIAGLDEKIRAAEEFGAKAVLVPESQKSGSAGPAVIGVSDIGEVMAQLEGD